jgi:hypothetical protein
MKTSAWLGSIFFVACLFESGAAWAGCSIHNATEWSFVVTSGNTSNQSVGAHTQTSIAAGKIVGKSKDGKTISGFCKNGDKLEITNDHGVPVLAHK